VFLEGQNTRIGYTSVFWAVTILDSLEGRLKKGVDFDDFGVFFEDLGVELTPILSYLHEPV